MAAAAAPSYSDQIRQAIDEDNVSLLVRVCADLEADAMAGGKVTPVELAGSLAMQILGEARRGNLEEARFAAKRASAAVRKAGPDVNAAEQLINALRARDMQAFFQAAAGARWSGRCGHVAERLVQTVRQNSAELIGSSYTTISVASAATLLGAEAAQMPELCGEYGWTIDGTTVSPKPLRSGTGTRDLGDRQLRALTMYTLSLERPSADTVLKGAMGNAMAAIRS